jgi:hypothetical protein
MTLPSTLNLFWSHFTKLKIKRIGLLSSSVTRHQHPDVTSRLQFKLLDNRNYPLVPHVRYLNSNDLLKLFVHSWTILGVRGTSEFKTHYDFQLMFMTFAPEKDSIVLFDARRFFARWLNSYNLLFNLFYVHAAGQMISNKLFIEESLTFNWHNNLTNYKLFKYTQPTFVFKDLPYGSYLHSALLTLLKKKIDYTLVVDLNNHKKLLHTFKRYNFYMIGLVPSNYSPWLVSFPVPASSDSPLTQLFFYKMSFLY